MSGLAKGTRVKWNSSGGVAHGRVLKELTRPMTIKSHQVNASEEDPQILVETHKGAKAAHKPESIEKDEDGGDESTKSRTSKRSSGESKDTETKSKTRSKSRSNPTSDDGVKVEENSGGDEPAPKKQKKTYDYVPTEKMAENAKLGLKLRGRFNRGGTEVGVNRAHQLADRRKVSVEDIKSMASYFARHEVDKSATRYKWGDNDRPSAGYIAWLLWGGDEGQVWAKERREALRK